MFASSKNIDSATITPSLSLGQAALVLILSMLLALLCLAQMFYAHLNYEGFIRTMELLFVGVFLIHTGRTYEAPAIKPVVALLFVGWLATATVSAALSSNVVPALMRHAEWLTHILFAFTLWHFLHRDRDSVKLIFLLIPLGFYLTGLYLISYWFALDDPRAFDWFAGPPLFTHIRVFCYYAVAGLIFSACPLLGFGKTVTWQSRALALAALSVCWGFLFWTGGRGAIGAGMVGLAFIVWFARKDQRFWVAGVALVAAGIGLWLSSFFWVEESYMGLFSAIERTAETSAAKGVEGFSTGRLTIWSTALAGLEGHLWFGLGPDGYRFLEAKHHGIQPHNVLVQFLVEWGVAGTIPFVMLLATAFLKAFQRLRKERNPFYKTARLIAFALVLATTTHALVSGPYYHAQSLLFLWTCLAVAVLPLPSATAKASPHPITARLASRGMLWIGVALLSLWLFFQSDYFYKIYLHLSG